VIQFVEAGKVETAAAALVDAVLLTPTAAYLQAQAEEAGQMDTTWKPGNTFGAERSAEHFIMGCWKLCEPYLSRLDR
jgi:hypothetical protein